MAEARAVSDSIANRRCSWMAVRSSHRACSASASVMVAQTFLQHQGVIYGLTIQKVGKSFELRCPECTRLSGRLGLVRQDGPPIRLLCKVHPENFGEWRTGAEMEEQKLALAGRIGLK